MVEKNGAYWREQLRAFGKGDITGKELARDAESWFADNGYLFHDILGWVKPEEITEAGIRGGEDGVPTDGFGAERRIRPEFLEYQAKCRREAVKREPELVDKVTDVVSEGFPGMDEDS